MKLSAKQKQFLKGLAHPLSPVAYLGQKGLTEAFYREVDRGLKDHELIKVKIACQDQSELRALTTEIMGQCQAACVQTIGHIMVLYRPAKEPKIKLPA